MTPGPLPPLDAAIHGLVEFYSAATRNWRCAHIVNEAGDRRPVAEVLSQLAEMCAPGEESGRSPCCIVGTDPVDGSDRTVAFFLNGPRAEVNTEFAMRAHRDLPLILAESQRLRARVAELELLVESRGDKIRHNIEVAGRAVAAEKAKVAELEARLAPFEALANSAAEADIKGRDLKPFADRLIALAAKEKAT